MKNEKTLQPLGRILILDSNSASKKMLMDAFMEEFEIKVTSSSDEYGEIVAKFQPDLAIIDADFPGINGYKVCKKIRKHIDIPVIFLSETNAIEEQLEAFGAGAVDFIQKTANKKILLSKVKLAMEAKKKQDQIMTEKNDFETMAMTFLDSMGESGVLQNFMRSNFDCPNTATLLENTFQATMHLGLNCHIQIRCSEGIQTRTPDGPPSPLEESILATCVDIGRLFEFRKRMIVNFDHVSILVMNMPKNQDSVGRIRDNIALLAEVADAFVKAIAIRKSSVDMADKIQIANLTASKAIGTLRERYRDQQVATRVQLEKLRTETEKAYIHLGLTDGQEMMINTIINNNSELILQQFERGVQHEKQFGFILDALSASEAHRPQKHMGKGVL